jgi:hypothetical protein
VSAGLDTRPNAITFDLEDLVEKARRGQIRIPHFQRPFRWGHEDVRRLFDSVLRGYPIGSVLLWLRPAPEQDLVLGNLRISAAKMDRAWWVVDGQQRITSLANALDPVAAKDPKFALGYDLAAEEFVALPLGSDRTVPLPVLFDLTELIQWFDERPELKQYLRRASEVAKTIRQFTIPAYQVEQDDVGVLQDIFDRLNNYGKRLSKAEVFTALNAGAEENSGRLTIPLIAENISAERAFGVLDEDVVLRAILARRRSDFLRDIRNEFDGRTGIEFPNEDQAAAHEGTQRALLGAVKFLQEHASVPHAGFLPHRNNLLIVLSRFFAHFPDSEGHSLRLLRRWFWRTVFISQEGFKGGSTQATLAMCAAIRPGDLAGSLDKLLDLASDDVGHPLPDLRRFRTSRVSTKIVLCSWWDQGPRSPESGARYDQSDLAEVLVDRLTATDAVPNIVSPRDLTNRLRQYVANRVVMPVLTAADSEVAPLLLSRPLGIAENAWEAVLDSHAMTPEALALLGQGRHAEFLHAREAELRARLERFLSRMCEWDFEDTPALSELDLDEDADEGDDDIPA